MKARFISSMLSIVAIVALAFLISGSCSRPPSKVKIGYVPYSSSTPFFVAVEKGLFRANNLEVEPVKFQTSNEAMDALLRGDVASVTGVGFPTYFAIEQNSPGRFRVIWGAVETYDKSVNSLLVPVDSALTSMEQLKGKRV